RIEWAGSHGFLLGFSSAPLAFGYGRSGAQPHGPTTTGTAARTITAFVGDSINVPRLDFGCDVESTGVLGLRPANAPALVCCRQTGTGTSTIACTGIHVLVNAYRVSVVRVASKRPYFYTPLYTTLRNP